MPWALTLALAPAAGAAESKPAAGIFLGPAREAVSEPGMGRMARAETLVPGRSDLPRVAMDLDGAAEASEGDLSEPAPGRIVEESLPPAGAEAPESSGAEFESPSAPAEIEASNLPAEDVEAAEAVPDSDESGNPAPPEDGIAPLVEYAGGRITVRADGEPLGDVISGIRAAGDIRIQGLSHRADDPLSFQVEDMDVEDALKRLMRQLKENNYAFEYSRTRLRRLSVFPAGQIEAARPAPRPRGGEAADGRERVVRVINVHEGTQAENLDLRQGDLIVDYDGETITSAQQLVDAVKTRSAEQIVQMTVVRDGNRFPLTLNGGLIGINILTVNVPPDQLGR